MTPDGRVRTVREAMDIWQPWFWEVWQMPPDQVERLTPRQADRFIERGLERQRKS